MNEVVNEVVNEVLNEVVNEVLKNALGYIYNIIYSLNFIQFLKFPECERSEPLFPLNFLLQFHTVPQISRMRAQRAPVPP